MKKSFAKALLLLTLPLFTTGCFVTKRKIPQAKPPGTILSAKASELVDKINTQYDAIHALNVRAEIQYSSINKVKGEQKDVTPFPTAILVKKPAMLRVLGFVPVVRSRAFDLASDGQHFKLVIPQYKKAYEGSNAITKPSKNPIENLRPDIFLDSLLIHRVEPDDLYSETATTKTQVDEKRKSLLEIPEYELSTFQRKTTSNELTPIRVVRFHREDLLPYEQDIYDAHGNLVTQVTYSDYQSFGYPTMKFAGTIVISRPLESYQITMTIENIKMNEPLSDEQFQLKFPEGIPVKELE